MVNMKLIKFGMFMSMLSLLLFVLMAAYGQEQEQQIINNEVPSFDIEQQQETTNVMAAQVFLEEVKKYERLHGKLTTEQQAKIDTMYNIIMSPESANITKDTATTDIHLQQWGKLLEAAPWDYEMPKFTLSKEGMIEKFIDHLERTMDLPTTNGFQKVILQALAYQMNLYLANAPTN